MTIVTSDITVVIPAYNGEHFIATAIESALVQTCPPSEIIVVDDGSKDATVDVISQFPSPVRLIQQANGGPASARNYGIREAKTDWIALLDADDSWMPNKLEKQSALCSNPRVGLVHAYGENGKNPYRQNDKIDFDTLWRRNGIITSSTLLRKSAVEQAGYFDEDRALISVEDYNLWLRLAHLGWEFATCPEPLIRYTPAEGNLSSQIERFAHAELANVDNIGKRLSLSDETLHAKRIAIYEEYGRDLLYERRMSAARRMLSIPLRDRPSLSRLKWWLATLIPQSALDWRRARNQMNRG